MSLTGSSADWPRKDSVILGKMLARFFLQKVDGRHFKLSRPRGKIKDILQYLHSKREKRFPQNFIDDIRLLVPNYNRTKLRMKANSLK